MRDFTKGETVHFRENVESEYKPARVSNQGLSVLVIQDLVSKKAVCIPFDQVEALIRTDD